jgi:hypothetical protein
MYLPGILFEIIGLRLALPGCNLKFKRITVDGRFNFVAFNDEVNGNSSAANLLISGFLDF